MRGKMVALISFSIVIGMFLLLHSTPNIALRTTVFAMGHPIKAISTGIIEEKNINKQDKAKYAKLNKKLYKLTKPPYEKGTGGTLIYFNVRKINFLYFANFCCEDPNV
ncbi:hypothetical protein [Neobacillus sp. PS3-40]|uniref:hypothetical protein n=1 Tax=Neobacillus sp. PS3-40 TaxID=3070679 RepID=UPI0027E2112B|nr:hypothetical protein [Neobacillus sp. PS3-40]WML44667.1 hypothetical protein RCG20_01770 [Neobacillus sp. PS3-40]